MRRGVTLFAITVAALALAAASALTWPQSASPIGSRLAPVRESRAEAALLAEGQNGTRAAQESRAALGLAPATATAWLRLAYLDYLRAGKFDGAVQASLERSFAAAPLGPDVTEWRVRFVFENWDQASPALRDLALKEFTAMASWRGARARNIASQVRNPAGRLAVTLAGGMARSQNLARKTR
jgi:hypothetical protein